MLHSAKKLSGFITLLCSAFFLLACHSSKKTAASKPLRPKELKRKYAQILDTKPRKIKNKALYYFIDDWNGVKYKWGGNDKKGVDCSGFAKLLYANVYHTDIKRTVATQHATTKNFKRKRRLREGDIIYFAESDDPSHVGIYLRNGFFVHSSKGVGVHISSLHDPYWKKVYTGGGKVKKKKS